MMKSLLALGVAGAAPRLRADQSLTIYNDGRVLVRREVAVAVPKGALEPQRSRSARSIPPRSFRSTPAWRSPGLSYDGATDEGSALRRSVGRSDRVPAARVQGHAERARARGRSAATPAARRPDHLPAPGRGAVSGRGGGGRSERRHRPLQHQGAEDAPPGLLHRRRDLAGELPGDARRPDGARRRGWRCSSRRPSVPKTRMSSSSPARSGRADKAPEPPRPMERRPRGGVRHGRPGRERAAGGRVPPLYASRQEHAAPGAHHFGRAVRAGRGAVRADATWCAGWCRTGASSRSEGEESEAPVEVSYTLKRPHKTEFGDRPLPGGVARIYQPDSAGRPQLVGEASMEHTPAGRDLRLAAGVAFDLTARRVQTGYVTRRDSTAAQGVRTVATADYRVTVRERHRQRRHRGRDRGAGGRVDRGVELGPCGEASPPSHPLPGKGARPRRGRSDVPAPDRLVR